MAANYLPWGRKQVVWWQANNREKERERESVGKLEGAIKNVDSFKLENRIATAQ